MQHDDLPLFTWSPPACVVVPFPASKRIGRVRHVAEILERKQENDASQYWRRIIADMSRQMEKAGIPSGQIEAETRAFFEAVEAELRRRARQPQHSPTPGGAA